MGVGTCGRAVPNRWRQQIQRKKILNLKHTVDLGGRRLLATHNNQLGVGGHGRRDVGEEARGGWNMWEGGVQFLEVMNSMGKYYRIKNTL